MENKDPLKTAISLSSGASEWMERVVSNNEMYSGTSLVKLLIRTEGSVLISVLISRKVS